MDQRNRQPLLARPLPASPQLRAGAFVPRLLVICCLLTIATGWVTIPARGDMTIYGYEDRLHDRFYVGSDREFIGEPYNWSGIGRMSDPIGTTDSNWKTVTMISDNWFITDQHHHPTHVDDPAGALPKVRFYRTNDPNGEYWESELATSGAEYQGTRVGSTDLWVGKLANTPPAWVTRYPLAKRQEGTNYLSYTDNDLFVFGQDSPRSTTSVRVGRNEVSEIAVGGEYYWNYDPPTGFGRDEAQTEVGDSGSPSFFLTGTVPVLAGTHTSSNIDAGVSANLSAIKAAIGESISVSTGLYGDVNGDYRVNYYDLYATSNSLNTKHGARLSQGDVNGDGTVSLTDLGLVSIANGKKSFAPSDFDHNRYVDGYDLAVIGDHWGQSVTPFSSGDADGNSLVNLADVAVFDRNQRRVFFGPLPPPLAPVIGDCDGNGVLDGADINIVSAHLNEQVASGLDGDVNGDGKVEAVDLIYVLLHSGDSFGDIDGDHAVGPSDFAVLAARWNQSVTGGRLQGDMNSDGIVNSQDAVILFQWWSVGAGGFATVVAPEPSSIALACFGSWLLWSAGYRRRRS